MDCFLLALHAHATICLSVCLSVCDVSWSWSCGSLDNSRASCWNNYCGWNIGRIRRRKRLYSVSTGLFWHDSRAHQDSCTHQPPPRYGAAIWWINLSIRRDVKSALPPAVSHFELARYLRSLLCATRPIMRKRDVIHNTEMHVQKIWCRNWFEHVIAEICWRTDARMHTHTHTLALHSQTDRHRDKILRRHTEPWCKNLSK